MQVSMSDYVMSRDIQLTARVFKSSYFKLHSVGNRFIISATKCITSLCSDALSVCHVVTCSISKYVTKGRNKNISAKRMIMIINNDLISHPFTLHIVANL